MKNILLFLYLFPFFVSSQKLTLSQGEIHFISNAQLEVIKASSKKLTGKIDLSTNQFAFKIDIKSFDGFNTDLQRDHFNENYMESEKFPTATFSGKIIESIDFNTNGEHEVRAKGELVIHGQSQIRIIKVKISIKDGNIQVASAFKVPLADHAISIPRIVNQKIATEIDVEMKGLFVRQ